ncbi:MAG TPA: PAC2 family protein [Thermoplasmata archaeon]|nr:PAC2 family protein [Thermoplasmata archaeon]
MAVTYEWTPDPTAAQPGRGAVVLSCFPSAGLATTVAAHYMVQALGLPRVGVFESADSMPLAIVQSGQVQPPIRVYGRPDLAIVVSEFPQSMEGVGGLAGAILAGAERMPAKIVLAIEGVVPHPTDDGEEGAAAADPATLPEEQVWSVPAKNDASLLEQFKRAKTRPLGDGVIGGVSGALLVRGLRSSVPVGALLVSARNEGYPDHRAGAALIEAIDRLFPEVKIDTGPLRTQAEIIERALRAAMRTQKSGGRAGNATGPPAPSADTQSIYQ